MGLNDWRCFESGNPAAMGYPFIPVSVTPWMKVR